MKPIRSHEFSAIVITQFEKLVEELAARTALIKADAPTESVSESAVTEDASKKNEKDTEETVVATKKLGALGATADDCAALATRIRIELERKLEVDNTSLEPSVTPESTIASITSSLTNKYWQYVKDLAQQPATPTR